MKTLIEKEARQVVLAHAVLGVVLLAVLLWQLPARGLLLPNDDFEGGAILALLFVILEGLLIGLFTFGYEHWSRTEAYLLHRGTTPSQVFAAKLVTGLASLALVSVLPLAGWYAIHTWFLGSVEGGRTREILSLFAVESAGVSAYAAGVFCSRLRTPWGSRVAMALLGGCTVLLISVAAAVPWGAEISASPLRFALVQLALAAVILTIAWRMFMAGDDEGHPWAARLSVPVGLLAMVLLYSPYGTGLRSLQSSMRKHLFASYPKLVATKSGEPVLTRKGDSEYEALDADERPIANPALEGYRGSGFDLDPFLNVFGPSHTRTDHTQPHDDVERGRGGRRRFEFQGQLMELTGWVRGPGIWFQPEDGLLYALERDQEQRRLVRLGEGAEAHVFSPRTVVTFLDDESSAPYLTTSRAALVDLDEGRIWVPTHAEEGYGLRPHPLPGDDRVVGLERVHSFFAAYAGLYEPFSMSDSLIVIGERDRYILTVEGAVAESDAEAFAELLGRGVPESTFGDAVAMRLEPKRIDGLGFTLDVRDARTDALLLTHEFHARTGPQRLRAGLALAASALMPPLGAARAFFFDAAPAAELRTRSRLWRDPLLLGGRRPWLLVLNLGLAIGLAWHGHRRLQRAGRTGLCTWTWTIGVLCLGAPAFVLAQVLESTPKRATATRSLAPEPALLIRTV